MKRRAGRWRIKGEVGGREIAGGGRFRLLVTQCQGFVISRGVIHTYVQSRIIEIGFLSAS